MSFDPKKDTFDARKLKLVSPSPPPDDPPLGVGDRCYLNSGGPEMLVVDMVCGFVIAAWRTDHGVIEVDFPRSCVRRA